MTKKIRVYCSGAMRGRPMWGFPAFDTARDVLEADGFEVVSPADMDRERGFDPTLPDHVDDTFTSAMWHEAMRRDIEALLTVDAVYLIRGWHSSVGANMELMVANALGLDIMLAPGALDPKYVRARRATIEALGLAI